MKPSRLRPRAEQDLTDETRYLAAEAGAALAERFFEAALDALQPIERMPAMGSPRIGQLCDVPGLRSWGVSGFRLRWFYFEKYDHLDVVRLLGEREDILSILAVDEDPPAS